MKKLIALVAVVLFTACKQEKQDPINVIVPIDISASHDSVVTKWYRDITVQGVLSNMQQNGCFTAIPVDHGSESSFEELYCQDFSKNSYSNEYAGLQADELAVKNHKDSLVSAGNKFAECFDSVCIKRKNLSNGTDIIGALKVAKKYKKPGARNIIIIMADMLHSVPEQGIDFEKKLNTKKDVEQFLSKMERIDLSGFEIVVLTGTQTKINTVKYGAVEDFWQQYFKECNAMYVNYSSGAVSQLEGVLLRTIILKS